MYVLIYIQPLLYMYVYIRISTKINREVNFMYIISNYE